MRPPGQKEKPSVPLTQAQTDMMKYSIEASARITASMVVVTQEKNAAKIGEAFKTIYKAIQETIKSP